MNHRTAPLLPFASPSWLRPTSIALVALTALAATAALPSVWWVRPARELLTKSPGVELIFTAVTALLSLLLALRALRAESVESAVIWSVLGAIPAGALNAGLTVAGIELFLHNDPGAAVIGFFVGCLFGGFVGGPIGLVFGFAYAFVIASAARARLSPSHDGPDRVLLTAGLLLALSGAALIHVADGARALIPPPALLFLGAGLSCVAIARLVRRTRWIKAVVEGRVPAFRIDRHALDDDPSGATERLLPIVRSKRSSLTSILVHIGPTLGGPYRERSSGTPVALVDLPRSALVVAESSGASAPAPAPVSVSVPVPVSVSVPVSVPVSVSVSVPVSVPVSVSAPASAPAPALPFAPTCEELRCITSALLVAFAKMIGITLVILIAAAAVSAPFLVCAFAVGHVD